MARTQAYEERIQQLDLNGLRTLWGQIINGETPEWPEGKAFEYLTLRAFQLNGAEVRWPFSVKINKEVVIRTEEVV